MPVKRIQRRAESPSPPGFLADEHPVLARIYYAREIHDPALLDYSLARLLPFDTLVDMAAAVDLLVDAVTHDQPILVVADFDADGATGCAVAMLGLRALGASNLDFLVPDRFTYGYGLSPGIAELASAKKPNLLITVDNGISSVTGVQVAKEHGIRVLVTDHHLPGQVLPSADAIVNPNQPGDAFPSKCIAGVGVIFYVLLGLRARLRSLDWFGHTRPEPNLAELLDLVALGTVADVVALDYNNRILVHQGLRRIRAGRARPGIYALLRAAGRDATVCQASDLSFTVAPRLNAAGRLTDMTIGIACLLADDARQVADLAAQLDELNRQRREIESEMRDQALAALESLQLDADRELPAGLCLFDAQWHQGVVGILAARIKERYNRPVIAFAPVDGGQIKGSARSVPGFHMRDALDAIAARNPHIISQFGGHAMAAGLEIAESNLAQFADLFAEQVFAALGDVAVTGSLCSDGEIAARDHSLDLARAIRDGGPWGQGFPDPMFDGEFEIVDRRVVGKNHLRLRLRLKPGDVPIEAIAFNETGQDWPPECRFLKVAYKLTVNDYRGIESAQMIIESAEPVG